MSLYLYEQDNNWAINYLNDMIDQKNSWGHEDIYGISDLKQISYILTTKYHVNKESLTLLERFIDEIIKTNKSLQKEYSEFMVPQVINYEIGTIFLKNLIKLLKTKDCSDSKQTIDITRSTVLNIIQQLKVTPDHIKNSASDNYETESNNNTEAEEL